MYFFNKNYSGYHKQLRELSKAVISIWPEHEKFLTKSFSSHSPEELGVLDNITEIVLALAGDHIEEHCRDYKWTCNRLIEEEIHFRRTGKYRLSSFVDADREVYSDPNFMKRYINGLLLSHVFWSNHAKSLIYYIKNFLPDTPPGYRLVEVGPGHGLFLYFAARNSECAHATGWDISQTSLNKTSGALSSLGITAKFELKITDVQDNFEPTDHFDALVINEVLEHLERPGVVLANLMETLKPGGRIFVGMPINSPAPDHIYLLKRPDEVTAMVRDSGYEVISTATYPVTGYTLEETLKNSLTCSCVVVAQRPL